MKHLIEYAHALRWTFARHNGELVVFGKNQAMKMLLGVA